MYVVDGTASAAGANTIDKKPAGTFWGGGGVGRSGRGKKGKPLLALSSLLPKTNNMRRNTEVCCIPDNRNNNS